MMNFSRRVKNLEERLGMEQERFILIITSADPEEFPEDSSFKEHEILPGVLCFVYGKPLSNEELAELRAKYASEGKAIARE
jgi:hypothetical protein